MDQVFFQVLQFPPVSIIPPMLDTHLHLIFADSIQMFNIYNDQGVATNANI
jgi:hypothetical protein